MQLIVFTNSGTCRSFKKLNEELQLSSFRLLKSKKSNPNFKQVCSIEIRGKYFRSKPTVDSDVLECMKTQIFKQMQLIDQSPEYHTTLHVYGHDGTFGLSMKKFVAKDKKKAVIRANQLVLLLLDYLKSHPECVKVKLHVCFSGCNYGGLETPYGQLVMQHLEEEMNKNNLEQEEIEVEGSNGWSILGVKKEEKDEVENHKRDDKTSQRWSHFVLPNTKEIANKICYTKDFQELIESHALCKKVAKPVWKAIRNDLQNHVVRVVQEEQSNQNLINQNGTNTQTT